jgi:AcrR family transcriptional regulator
VTTDGDQLPRSLQVLWDRAGRPSRGPQQALSLDRIVEAGIAIADADGLAALSMARLAERLGCATMSLYRHVSNKDELLVFMMDAAPGAPPELPDGTWREKLGVWASALREVYYAHPWILQVVSGRPPLEPGQLTWLDRGLATLDDTGLGPQDRMSVVMLVVNYIRGEAQIMAVLMMGGADAGRDPRETQAEYARTIARFVHADRFPALAALSDAGVFRPDAEGPTYAFDFALARILDGVDALLQERVTP